MEAVGLVYAHTIGREEALAFGKTLGLKPEQVLCCRDTEIEPVTILWEPDISITKSTLRGDSLFGRIFGD